MLINKTKKYYSKHRESVLDGYLNCENFAVMTGFHHPTEQKSMGYDLFISPVAHSTQEKKFYGIGTPKKVTFLLKYLKKYIKKGN